MRMVIVVEDEFISVDSRGYSDCDVSFMPENASIVQWDGVKGRLYQKDADGNELDTLVFDDIAKQTWYAAALSEWEKMNEPWVSQMDGGE